MQLANPPAQFGIFLYRQVFLWHLAHVPRTASSIAYMYTSGPVASRKSTWLFEYCRSWDFVRDWSCPITSSFMNGGMVTSEPGCPKRSRHWCRNPFEAQLEKASFKKSAFSRIPFDLFCLTSRAHQHLPPSPPVLRVHQGG